jgi:hypothetical protein
MELFEREIRLTLFANFSQNALQTDGYKVVSPTHSPHFTPQKHYYFYVSGTNFC